MNQDLPPTAPARLISFAASGYATKTESIPLGEVLEWIRTGEGELARRITRLRDMAANGEKETAAKAKLKLPAVIPSGTFEKKAKPMTEQLVAHSGLLCADIDSLGERLPEVRERLEGSEHVFALFTSPSGSGLKVWFRVPADAARHYGSFLAVKELLLQSYNVKVDEKCSDLGRLCFLSHDPEIHVNEGATELAPVATTAKPKDPVPQLSEAEAERRRRIAEDIFEDIEWEDNETGFCECPGEHLHSTSNGTLLRIKLDDSPLPTAYCFHNSCKELIDDRNRELRSRVEEEPEIQRLASLSEVRYEQQRKEAAKALGVRASALDTAVAKARGKEKSDDLQGSAVDFPGVESWPEAVNAAEVLDEISRCFARYVSLPPGAADALALWCAHSHCFSSFICSPRLNITSPEKGCGKTTLRDVVELFVPKPLATENMSPAVLFRMVDKHAPTVLADEYDSWLKSKEDLVGLLNAGHRRGRTVQRCVGDDLEPRSFRASCPVVLCGIGALTGTLHDRSIVVRLERAKRGELRQQFDPRRVEEEKSLCRKLARWVQDCGTALEECDPQMPESAYNRVADNWRPLFAIAETAGGEWPARCKDAFEKLTKTGDEEESSLRIELLTDIRKILYGAQRFCLLEVVNFDAGEKAPSPTYLPSETGRVFSRDLCDALQELPESPWSEVRTGGKPINERWLGHKLREFKIKSRTRRIGDKTAKGYDIADFENAFSRYLPAFIEEAAAEAA